MSEMVAVPTYLLDEINERLDEAMPAGASDEDRAALRMELLSVVDECGYLPDFTVERET